MDRDICRPSYIFFLIIDEYEGLDSLEKKLGEIQLLSKLPTRIAVIITYANNKLTSLAQRLRSIRSLLVKQGIPWTINTQQEDMHTDHSISHLLPLMYEEYYIVVGPETANIPSGTYDILIDALESKILFGLISYGGDKPLSIVSSNVHMQISPMSSLREIIEELWPEKIIRISQ